MRRIEITEPLLRDGRHVHREGDVVTVDEPKARLWLDNGWARDPDTGEQNERRPGVQPIQPHKVTQDQG